MGVWGVLGCQESSSFECGDLICSADTVCAPDERSCVFQEQLGICDADDEGEPCTVAERGDGVCVAEVCETSVCGDGHVSGREMCDDGNTVNADGCRADCRSDETCGNGVLDAVVGEGCDPAAELAEGLDCKDNCVLASCGDGQVDDLEVCDDGNVVGGDGCNARCSSDETCGNGVIDAELGEECDGGDQCSDTCTLLSCGNGSIEGDEECDDGNVVAGDGCGATCVLEGCGNGFVDFGEACDDGNFRNHDGCDSICQTEAPVWTELLPVPGPRATRPAYDSDLDRIVVYGGNVLNSPSELSDTWIFENSHWRELRQTRGPQRPQSTPSVVYDSGAQEVLLIAAATSTRDVYLLDGDSWVQQSSTAFADRVQADCFYVYDTGRDDVLGACADGELRARGLDWAVLTALPEASEDFALVHDQNLGVTSFVDAAEDDMLVSVHDLSVGNTWTERAATGAPTKDDVFALVDPVTAQIYVCDGLTTERLNGGAWESVAGGCGSAGGVGGSSLYAGPALGLVSIDPALASGLERIVGSSWQEVVVPAPPIDRYAQAAYNPEEDVVLAQMEDGSFWTFDGGWAPLGATIPATLGQGPLVYDEANTRFILMAPDSGDPGNASIWSLDGDEWTRLGDVNHSADPSAPVELRFDSASGRVIGVWDTPFQITAWDGDTWEVLFEDPDTYESWASGRVAWDAETQTALGSGLMTLGEGVAEPDSGFWTWDESGFSFLDDSAPAFDRNNVMAYFPPLGTFLALAGQDQSIPTASTWLFDEGQWADGSPATSPTGVLDGEGVYRSSHQDLFRFGGTWFGDILQGTWSYRWESTLPDEDCGNMIDDDSDELVDCADDDCDCESEP